jgi:hypothetical protein
VYCGSGTTNYSPRQIYDEVLVAMDGRLRKTFADGVKNGKFLTIIVDLTPTYATQVGFLIFQDM